MMTVIKAFKGRTVDVSARVWVYRNLHGKSGHRYSLRQRGLVVAHGDTVILSDVRFVVSESGRQRVIATRRKNVHAYIVGKLALSCDVLPLKVIYNPYTLDRFHAYPSGTEACPEPIPAAAVACIGITGVYASR